MTSDKQIKANQENAKLGGVKTEEGKEISKYNALKHGLLSKEVLLDDENEEELSELLKRLRATLKPVGEIEQILVDRITANTWRLKRALKIEREMIINETEREMGDFADKTVGEAFSKDFANYDTYGKFTRYETCIENGIYKALKKLQELQATGKNSNPLPTEMGSE